MRCHVAMPGRFFWALLCGVLLLPAAARGQEQLGDNDTLSKAYDQNIERRKELFAGTATASGPADKKIAEASARWFIYRISHKSAYLNPANLAKIHKDFNDVVVNTLMEKDKVKTNRAFINMFGPALVQSMKDVLKEYATGRPEVYIHACMMFQTMAKLKQDDVGDYLMSLVSDSKATEVARLHALKALKEFMPVDSLDGEFSDLSDKKVLAKKVRDVKCIDTLVKYIEMPINVEAMLPDEAAAVIFLRREAIISLANAEAPAVAAIKKLGKIEGGVAPTLLRVIAGNLEPAATLQEKIEAAIGLCKMRFWNPAGSPKIKNGHLDEYQAELSIYLIGKTLDEFIGAYKADHPNFSRKDKDRKLPRIAFRVDAKRFEAALNELVANTEGSPAAANAKKLKTEATQSPNSILLKISQYANVDSDNFFRQKVVPSLRPKTGYVFKTLKTAEIPLGQP